jgi:hypothetical protein
LAIGRHDGLTGTSARCRIASPSPMFRDDPRPAFGITPRTPRHRLDQNLDLA